MRALSIELVQPFELHIHRTKPNTIQRTGKNYRVHLRHADFFALQERLAELRSEKNKKSNDLVAAELARLFRDVSLGIMKSPAKRCRRLHWCMRRIFAWWISTVPRSGTLVVISLPPRVRGLDI